MAIKIITEDKFTRDFEILADLYKNKKSAVDSLLIFSSSIVEETNYTDTSSPDLFENYSLKNEAKNEGNKVIIELLLHTGKFM